MRIQLLFISFVSYTFSLSCDRPIQYKVRDRSDCWGICGGSTGRCGACGHKGYCCNENYITFPYCRPEMAKAIKKYGNGTIHHHICVQEKTCETELYECKRKSKSLYFWKRQSRSVLL